ncbi:hypothetical protein GCM10010123_09530 [Pilimelia anulata]|uniref:Uncharacterized protein n=1 Tax=Pilimelia anulata TaxID=53371 RepID=A0A8J3F7T6_9ACTN|nr:hypothetical protein [Pilimelia anulata]GGJ81834.1 hypothetical protein GCM10010123_09530 [Pilimelia anulata]
MCGLSYSQFIIRDIGTGPEDDIYREPGSLVAVADDQATVYTATQIGTVQVDVQPTTEAQPVDLDGWDEAVAFSITSDGELTVCGLMGDLVDDMPNLAAAGPGTYVRTGWWSVRVGSRSCTGCRHGRRRWRRSRCSVSRPDGQRCGPIPGVGWGRGVVSGVLVVAG